METSAEMVAEGSEAEAAAATATGALTGAPTAWPLASKSANDTFAVAAVDPVLASSAVAMTAAATAVWPSAGAPPARPRLDFRTDGAADVPVREDAVRHDMDWGRAVEPGLSVDPAPLVEPARARPRIDVHAEHVLLGGAEVDARRVVEPHGKTRVATAHANATALAGRVAHAAGVLAHLFAVEPDLRGATMPTRSRTSSRPGVTGL